LANLSCANDIPFESILRQNDVQNRFHTASVISGQTVTAQNPPLSAIVRKRPNNGPGCAALHADSQRVMESF
jgi:hypothetical protein